MSFAIELTNPRAGWLDVEVSFEGHSPFAFCASHVLNDPIRELAVLGLFLLTGQRGRFAVRFWLEPEGYELAATEHDDTYSLQWSYAEEASPDLRDPTRLLDRPFSPRAIASELLRALRAAEPLLPAKRTSSVWQHPFPADAVARLADALAARA